MAYAFDGSYTPDTLPALPCGGVPHFDHSSGYSYRCDSCNAVIGSVGMPKKCYDTYKKNESERINVEKKVVRNFPR